MEENWDTANVLADGPSALEATEEDLLPGPTIAVNCSLRLRERLPVTIWATVDSPANLWEPMQPWIDDDLLIMTTENNLKVWSERIDLTRIFIVEPYYMKKPGTDEVFRDETGMKVMPPTLGFVLSWLWKIPVPHVRVFGADMKGQFSPFHPSETFDPEDTLDTSARWGAERVFFAEAMRFYRQKGYRLERYSRRPRRSQA